MSATLVPGQVALPASVPSTPATLAPVAPEERIHALDLLRGWAMFGVLWSNLNDWYSPTDPVNRLDRGLGWTQNWLIESRFYSLLCILFGIGFGIQLLRASERGVDVTTTYYRRSAALLVIGLVHGTLIWSGDILTMYALVSFALVLFRTATAKQVLVAAAVIWIVSRDIVTRAMWMGGMLFWTGFRNSEIDRRVLAHGSWTQIQSLRVATYNDWFAHWGLWLYFSILAMFLAGLWAVKSGYLTRVTTEPRVTRRLLLISVTAAAIGYAADNLFFRVWPFPRTPFTGFSDPRFWLPRWSVYNLFGWATLGGALAYASVLLLLWQVPRYQRFLRPLAQTGRMALTTYLTQSAISTMLFFSYGVRLYGTMSYTGLLVITLVLFGSQMAFSTWWLRRFRFGPVEWLWRTLSYGRRPRMRYTEQPA
jgi:uncharacterized protein